MKVNSLEIDPKNPNTLWAGTGEGFFNSDAVKGEGIFKTTDGGETWILSENKNTVNAQDMYFFNSNEGIIVAKYGDIYY